jgi:hypothetical protein
VYGNKHKLSAHDAVDPDILFEPSGCWKLDEYAIKMVNQWFISMCPGLHTTIRNIEYGY